MGGCMYVCMKGLVGSKSKKVTKSSKMFGNEIRFYFFTQKKPLQNKMGYKL